MKGTDYDLLSPDLVKYLKEKEEALKFPAFDAEIAFELGCVLRKRFIKESSSTAGAVIQIRAFPYAQQSLPNILFSCLVGAPAATSPQNFMWIEGKARVCQWTGKSSFLTGRELAVGKKNLEDVGMAFPEFVCHGGGFPVYLENNPIAPVGVILVSGLPQAADHQLIVDTLEDFLPTLRQK